MLPRLIVACLVCVLLGAGLYWLSRPASPEAALAGELLGERWYSLRHDDRHLGYWHTNNERDSDGNWVFESEQRFAMNPYDTVTTSARRVFSSNPPHALLEAEHLVTRRDHESGVRIQPRGYGYEALRLSQDGGPPRRLDWSYSLAQYLEFELWLRAEQPPPGATRVVATLDFERSALVPRGFDVVGRENGRYLIENAAPYSATRIELDDNFAPRTVEIAGLFDLHRSTREEALAPRSTLQAASYHIPLDRRLPDHTRIARLDLAIDGVSNQEKLFPQSGRSSEGWLLRLSGETISNGTPQIEDRSETLHLPVGHPELVRLAERAVLGIEGERDRGRALNQFVHQYLTYRPGNPPQSLLGVIKERRGDCTEFADLLTALARSQGLAARTIFGLAYADGQTPAFDYHAWNELYLDGRWVAMDPTWGQDRIDATHIALPQDETAALALLTGSARPSFRVLALEHYVD
ncbi:MAG: transglutaminase-like domain-containing protein [Pseudomonadota bacterium]